MMVMVMRMFSRGGIDGDCGGCECGSGSCVGGSIIRVSTDGIIVVAS